MNNELGWTRTDKAGGREDSAQNTGRCREKDEGAEWRGAKTDGKGWSQRKVVVVEGGFCSDTGST